MIMKGYGQHVEVLERLTGEENFWQERSVDLLVEHLISEDALG